MNFATKTSMSKNKKRRWMKSRMFFAQNGQCAYCQCHMILDFAPAGVRPKYPPEYEAVLYHVTSRYHEERQMPKHAWGPQSSLICRKCSDEMSHRMQQRVPIQERQERSGHGATESVDWVAPD